MPPLRQIVGNAVLPAWFQAVIESRFSNPEMYMAITGMGLLYRWLPFLLKEDAALEKVSRWAKTLPETWKQHIVDAFSSEIDEVLDGLATLQTLESKDLYVAVLSSELCERRDDLESVAIICKLMLRYDHVGLLEAIDLRAEPLQHALNRHKTYNPLLQLVHTHFPDQWWGSL
jgi:hypothetical protein